MRRLLLPILALAAGASVAGELPARVTLEYELRKGGVGLGVVQEVFSREGMAYVVSSDARPRGVLAAIMPGQRIRRESRGTVVGDRLRPDVYTDHRKEGLWARARFDWAAGKILLEHKGERSQEPLPAGAHDRLSFAYQFSLRPPVGRAGHTYMSDGRRLSRYEYTISRGETLKTGIGELETIVIRNQRDDKRTEIWLSVKHHLLPVRILVDDNDSGRMDQVLTRIAY